MQILIIKHALTIVQKQNRGMLKLELRTISFDKNRTKRQDYPRIRDKPTNNIIHIGIRGRIKLSPVYANIDKPNP